MRFVFMACALILASPAFVSSAAFVSPAMAKNPISPAFDGSYIPRITGVEGMSGPTCQPFTVAPLSITGGHLISSARGGLLNGIVTTDGFVTGYLVRTDKSHVTFEGRFVDGAFSGGIVEGACAWTVHLEKQ